MIKRNILLTFALLVAISVVAQPKIVAHKGYYQKGVVPSNSIEALKRAQNEGFDIVEFDVNMSADGELLVLHGDWHPSQKAKNKVHAQHNTKEAIQAILLSNGEKVPTFEEWIAQAAKCDKTKMLIEIKGHDTPAIDAKVVKKIQTTLKKYNMQDKVHYLVGHEFLVRELVRRTPKGTPIALTNNYYSPAFCHTLGCSIAGRDFDSWRRHPDFIEQARQLGMELMAWTVNDPEKIEWLVEQGFDYILTDKPTMMRRILEKVGKR